MRKFLLFLITLFFANAASIPASALEGKGVFAASPTPAYVAAENNLSKFFLYADGGFHADWYVGYNNCWTVQLPPINTSAYKKAYLGAKIGRAKIKSWPNSWDSSPIPGKIHIAINDTYSFNSEHAYVLADAKDLPLEPLPGDYLEGVDSAQWFWTPIPISKISKTQNNFLALWSSGKDFVSSSSAPIVAAAMSDDGMENVWLSRNIKGAPPSGESALETPISGLKPALAIKLVPQNDFKVAIKGFYAQVSDEQIDTFFTAVGEDVRAAWLEISYDKFDWQRVGRYFFRTPYFRSFGRREISDSMFYIRAAAVDSLENIGYSNAIKIPGIKKGE
ncbi:MAG: hypothetical protein K5838_02040 [Elusimicrobiales bacterium]|nr:hypothetical protein [Elusimicrobiales bacterium]